MKRFNAEKIRRDINEIDWEQVSSYGDPNTMWVKWKGLFLSVADKHVTTK